MFNRPPSSELEQRQRNAYWQKIIDKLAILAELANAGIFIEALGRWFPPFASFVAATPLAYLLLIGDPLIYCFRALIRLTRLVGKNVFGIEFEEEKNGRPPKWQTLSDVLSLCCFSLAVVLFCGALVAPPVGITLAWTMGLCGVGFVSFTDYLWPEKLAYKKFESLLENKEATDEMKVDAYREYAQLKKARQMYVGLIFNLALLLICGSAVAFAPPLLVPILAIVSNAASLVLGAIGCGRLYNWYTSRKTKEAKAKEETSVSSTPAQSQNEIELMPLGSRLKFSRTSSPSSSAKPLVFASIPSPQSSCTTLSVIAESKSSPVSLRSSSPARDGFFSQSQSEDNLSPCSLESTKAPQVAEACLPVLAY